MTDHTQPAAPLARAHLLSVKNITILVVALVCLIASLGLDVVAAQQAARKQSDHAHAVQAFMQTHNGQAPAAEPPEFEWPLTSVELWSTLAREMAFALLIALVIAITIEQKARSEDTAQHEAMRKEIGQDVFRAIMSRRLPPQLFEVAYKNIVLNDVVRDYVYLRYTISPLSEQEESDLQVVPGSLVRMKTVVKYRLRNISGAQMTKWLNYAVPTRSGALAHYGTIRSMKIGTYEPGEGDIRNMCTEHDGFRMYTWDVVLKRRAPNDHIDIEIESEMIKELSDSEVFGNYYPTLQVRLTVQVMAGFNYGVRDLSSTDATLVGREQATGYGEWTIDGPMLSRESLIFWWRSPEDDGSKKVAGRRGRRRAKTIVAAEGTGASDA